MYSSLLLCKLSKVQESLMGHAFESLSLEDILPVIFEECLKEKIVFYFSFVENTAVLNLRVIGKQNSELNVRLHYGRSDLNQIQSKTDLLVNTFLLLKNPVDIASSENISQEHHKTEPEINDEIHHESIENTPQQKIILSDEVMPKSIRKAVDRLEQKGVPVTVESIRNHLPLSRMSNSNRIECNNYLKKMENSQ